VSPKTWLTVTKSHFKAQSLLGRQPAVKSQFRGSERTGSKNNEA
jgi:hypothetical protein